MGNACLLSSMKKGAETHVRARWFVSVKCEEIYAFNLRLQKRKKAV